MGFRFRKSIKIAPGLKINLGKTGASLSVGGQGATVNVSKRGTRTTLGIPGTGLSYSKKQPRPSATPVNPNSAPPRNSAVLNVIITVFMLWVAYKIFS